MPIELSFARDPLVDGYAAYDAQADRALEEQLRYEEARADKNRQFDQQLRLQYLTQGLADQRRGQALALEAYQGDARLGLGYDQLGAETALRADYQDYQADAEMARIEQQMLANQEATERSRISQMGQLAREQERQTMERALAAQKAIMDYDGFTSQQQFDETVAQWEQDFGMPWNFPQRAIAEHAQRDFAARKQQFVGAMAALTGLPPNEFDSLVVEDEGGQPMLMGAKPQDLFMLGQHRMDSNRMYDIADKNNQAKLDLETHKAILEAPKENAKEDQKIVSDSSVGFGKWMAAQGKYQADVAKYEADLAAHNAEKAAHNPEDGKAFTKSPPIKPIPPNAMQFADKMKTPRTPEEANSYPDNTYVIGQDGKVYLKLGTDHFKLVTPEF